MNDEEFHATHAASVQQSGKTEADEIGISSKDEDERSEEENDDTPHEHSSRRNISAENELIQSSEDILRAVQILNTAAVSEQWSGLLPSPNDWNQYPSEAHTKQDLRQYNRHTKWRIIRTFSFASMSKFRYAQPICHV